MLLQRTFPVPPCADDEIVACGEPALGPLIGDADDDGVDDLLVGWNRGRSWEAFGSTRADFLFGATASERGRHAVVGDVDDNGLMDIILSEEGSSPETWLLGLDLEPPTASIIIVD